MKKPITYVFHIYQNRESGEFLAFRYKELGYGYPIPEVIKQHGEPFHRLYAKVQAPTLAVGFSFVPGKKKPRGSGVSSF